jgi:IPT/TIG domain-containing protein
MVNGNDNQIERLIQAVNDIADLIPTSAESSADGSGKPGAVGGLPLDQLVDANIGHILGANPSKDPQRIVNLLTGAFAKPAGGATSDYQWRQRGSVPAEASNGVQVSGQQAAIYQELKDREDAADRLLDAVVPVILDPDEDEINEVKDRIRTTLSGIVSESGRPAGAVLDRIDVLFETLDSDLQQLKRKLGLDQDKLPSTEGVKKNLDFATAEQIEANFESLENIYIGKATLTDVRKRLKDANDSSGTRLSRLLRSIEAIPNTVQQALSVMNSVRFGAAERRVTGVENDNDTTTFEQLFDWIEQSASADWPNILIGGGAKRSEVVAVRLAAQKQRDKLNLLTRNDNARLKQLMDVGVNRVSTVVAELGRELRVVKDLTAEITNLPSVQAITPNTGDPAGVGPVTITGFNLQSVVKVFFGDTEGTIIPSTTKTSINVIPPKHAAGIVDVKVTDYVGNTDTLPEGFTYEAPISTTTPTPDAKLFTPSSGPATEETRVVISGSNLSKVTKVTFGGFDGTNVEPDPGGSFIKVTAPPHAAGPVDVVLTADNVQWTVVGGFTYIEPTVPTPEPKLFTPTSGPVTGGTRVVISGLNLSTVSKVSFGSIDVDVNIADRDPEGFFIKVDTPALTPPFQAGDVPVVAKDADDKEYPLTPDFNYTPTDPTFKLLFPDRGRIDAPPEVVIVGTNLSNVIEVNFGEKSVSGTGLHIDQDGGSYIKLTAPPNPLGSVDVFVKTNVDNREYKLRWQFTYFPSTHPGTP